MSPNERLQPPIKKVKRGSLKRILERSKNRSEFGRKTARGLFDRTDRTNKRKV
jgi:hypothetical protein